MKKKDDDIREIVSYEARDKKHAVIDLKRRDKQIRNDYWWFFEDAEHLEKIDLVNKIIRDFFGPTVKVYPPNARAPNRVPMSVIKVHDPRMLTMVDSPAKQLYKKKLDELGVEVVHSSNTDSYLHHIM